MIEQCLPVPVQKRLVPAHAGTLAASQDKAGYRAGGHDVDINSVVPLRWAMKRKTSFRLAFALILIGAFSLSLSAQNTKFMSVDEIRPGMKGFGKTVFQGTKIEQFDVELLGVLKNIAPKQDMILTRLSGGPLEHTGVIAGMSGSPVFVDGKLIGAVAFAFPFAKEPIAA